MHAFALLLSTSSWLRLVKRNVVSLLLLLAIVAFGKASAQNVAPASAKAASAKVAEDYGRLPLSFAPVTTGDSRSDFISRGAGYKLLLSSVDSVLTLGRGTAASSVRMQLVGGNSQADISREEELPGKSNYLIGKDSRKWRTNVPNYGRIRYKNVYRGIDLVYYGNQRRLEHDFVLAPGADPGNIRIRLSGASKLELEQGDLVIQTSAGKLRLIEPEIYQGVDSKRQKIAGHYLLLGENTVGFEIAPFDRRRQLVIDPVLSYSSYLGGSGYDLAYGIAVDSSGSAYITGTTNSTDLQPAPGDCISKQNGCAHSDVFVTKLSADGKSAVYSTLFGGANDDVGLGIAVDSDGHSYVTGYTSSDDFPVQNAYQDEKQMVSASGSPKPTSYNTAFVAKLNAEGSGLIYSTYLGGSAGYMEDSNDDDGDKYDCDDECALVIGDYGQRIALDSSGQAYVTGATACSDFPTTANALYTDPGVGYDGFVAKLAANGQSLVYSTYLGGTGDDYASGIALDSSSNFYVTGTTGSTDFPIRSAYQDHHNGSTNNTPNAFITKIKADGSALVYSTYLGGSGGDSGDAIAVDSGGRAYVTGATASADFPRKNPQLDQPAPADGTTTAFVTELAADGQSTVYSTYLGTGNGDFAHGIAVDSAGNAFVTGETSRTPQSSNPVHKTAFVAKLAANGQSVVYNMSVGGTGDDSDDYGLGIAVDSGGSAYVTGYTTSASFPAYNAVQNQYGGLDDAFAAKIVEPTTPWLWVSPSKLTFTAARGGSSPASQPIHISDLGTGSLNWNASYTSSWLSLDTMSGTSTSGGPNSLANVSVNTTGMTVGAYTDVVTVTASGASGSPATVDVTLNVNRVATVTTLQTSATTTRLRENVTFRAAVTSTVTGIPSGTVTLMDGTTVLGEATLDATGTALFTVSTLSLGTHNINAVYGGDADFDGSMSSPVRETINGNSSEITLQTSSAAILLLNNVTLTARVTSSGSGTPTGTVAFMEGATALGNAVLSPNGAAVLTISTLALGSHDITATYSGDSSFGGSTSSSIMQTVQDFQFGSSGSGSVLTATVQAGGTAHYQLQLNPVNGTAFPSAITFTVSGLPAGGSYNVTPSSIASGSQGQSVTVDVRTSTLGLTAGLKKSLNGIFLALALLPVLGLAWNGPVTRRRLKRVALFVVLLALAVSGVSCSSSNSTPSPTPQSYTIELSATSGPLTHFTRLVLTIR